MLTTNSFRRDAGRRTGGSGFPLPHRDRQACGRTFLMSALKEFVCTNGSYADFIASRSRSPLSEIKSFLFTSFDFTQVGASPDVFSLCRLPAGRQV